MARGAGEPLREEGISAPKLFMSVLLRARMYNLNPSTSVVATVTLLVPVASIPPDVGVIGMLTLPFVAIDKDVAEPYGTFSL